MPLKPRVLMTLIPLLCLPLFGCGNKAEETEATPKADFFKSEGGEAAARRRPSGGPSKAAAPAP